MKAEVFSRDNCPFCVMAKTLLEKREIDFEVLDATAMREALIERVTKDTGVAPRTVPQIYLDGQYIGGYDNLVEYFNKLDARQADGA